MPRLAYGLQCNVYIATYIMPQNKVDLTIYQYYINSCMHTSCNVSHVDGCTVYEKDMLCFTRSSECDPYRQRCQNNVHNWINSNPCSFRHIVISIDVMLNKVFISYSNYAQRNSDMWCQPKWDYWQFDIFCRSSVFHIAYALHVFPRGLYLYVYMQH